MKRAQNRIGNLCVLCEILRVLCGKKFATKQQFDPVHGITRITNAEYRLKGFSL